MPGFSFSIYFYILNISIGWIALLDINYLPTMQASAIDLD